MNETGTNNPPGHQTPARTAAKHNDLPGVAIAATGIILLQKFTGE
jgi:hypothetical protein